MLIAMTLLSRGTDVPLTSGPNALTALPVYSPHVPLPPADAFVVLSMPCNAAQGGP
jgi:hypothetical protein